MIIVGVWLLVTASATALVTEAVALVAHNVIARATFGAAPSGSPRQVSRVSATGPVGSVLLVPAAPAPDAAPGGQGSGAAVGASGSSAALPGTVPASHGAGQAGAASPPPSSATTPPRSGGSDPTGTSPPDSVSEPSTATTTPATTPPTSEPVSTTAPPTTATTAPPVTTVPTTAPPTTLARPPVVVFTSAGGSVSVSCPTASTISLIAVSPAPGYRQSVDSSGPGAVEVSFSEPGHYSGFELYCSGGTPRSD